MDGRHPSVCLGAKSGRHHSLKLRVPSQLMLETSQHHTQAARPRRLFWRVKLLLSLLPPLSTGTQPSTGPQPSTFL